jgi:hypothetical protein
MSDREAYRLPSRPPRDREEVIDLLQVALEGSHVLDKTVVFLLKLAIKALVAEETRTGGRDFGRGD